MLEIKNISITKVRVLSKARINWKSTLIYKDNCWHTQACMRISLLRRVHYRNGNCVIKAKVRYVWQRVQQLFDYCRRCCHVIGEVIYTYAPPYICIPISSPSNRSHIQGNSIGTACRPLCSELFIIVVAAQVAEECITNWKIFKPFLLPHQTHHTHTQQINYIQTDINTQRIIEKIIYVLV